MKRIIIIMLLLVPNIAFAENLIVTEALQGRIKIQLPSTFEQMEQKMLEFKYPASNRPTEVYTNRTRRQVSVLFTLCIKLLLA